MREKLRKYIRPLYILAAVLSFGIGGAIAFIGNNAGNPVIIVVGFAGLAGGVLLIRQWREVKESRQIGKVVENPNCLTISESHIEFAKLAEDKLQGLSQKCYNDGNYYHVHRVNNGEGPTHFELPDDDENERFYDPSEMANVVTMPSNKKYFTWSATLMQTIRVGLMALVVGGLVIGLIAMGE